MKVSVVISAGDNFCCNHTTDLCIYSNYASDSLLHFGRFPGLTFCYLYVGGSFCNDYASDCFCCSYAVRAFCSTMQVTVSAANMWVTIFIVIMQMESLLQLCRWHFLQCIMHMTVSIVIMQVAFLYS